MKRILLLLLFAASMSLSVAVRSQPADASVADAKKISSGGAQASWEPALEDYARFEKTAPKPAQVAPVTTQLPLELRKGQRIALIGNTLFDRDMDFGHFETLLHQRFPKHELVVRNLSWSADEVDLQPRPDNFATLEQQLTFEQADIIFAAFGFNESFAGSEGLPAFGRRVRDFLETLKTSAFNGRSAPSIVLVSPIANENVTGVAAADLNNARLLAYTDAMREVAAEQQVGFADVFGATRSAMESSGSDLTFNGIHLEGDGYEIFGRILMEEVFGEGVSLVNEELRQAVVEKNRRYFRRYRPLNTFYYNVFSRTPMGMGGPIFAARC